MRSVFKFQVSTCLSLIVMLQAGSSHVRAEGNKQKSLYKNACGMAISARMLAWENRRDTLPKFYELGDASNPNHALSLWIDKNGNPQLEKGGIANSSVVDEISQSKIESNLGTGKPIGNIIRFETIGKSRYYSKDFTIDCEFKTGNLIAYRVSGPGISCRQWQTIKRGREDN